MARPIFHQLSFVRNAQACTRLALYYLKVLNIKRCHTCYGYPTKWLSPGLKMCIQHYILLPRPAGATLFFIPYGTQCRPVRFRRHLKTFIDKYLPRGAIVTPMLMRIWIGRVASELIKTDTIFKALAVSTSSPQSDIVIVRLIMGALYNGRVVEWDN